MSRMEHWRLAITPLSPVHLGTGQDYVPTGYVIDGGALHEFDALAALAALPDTERQRLNQILDARPTPDMLRAVQAFFFSNRERLIAVARHQVRVNPTIEAFYQERVGKIVQNEGRGQGVQNRLEIERTAWSSATGQAILPGSGLKGAIRTALLDTLLQSERSLPTALKQDRQGNRTLQESLFGGRFERDPLRLLRIGDAEEADPGQMATEVWLALNRKKKPVLKDGRLLDSQAERQGLYQLLECLPPMLPRAFAGSLSLQDTGGIPSQSWPNHQYTLAEIADACNRFYHGHLQRELGILRSMGYHDPQWLDQVEQLLTSPAIQQAMQQHRCFLLRAGRHSGAESVTLQGMRHIRILRGKGNPAEFLDHAKTLWLAGHETDARSALLPFGWLLVEAWQPPEELGAWPTGIGNPGIAQWRHATLQRRAQLHAVLEQKQQAEMLTRQAAAAAAQAAQEQAARRAAMSPEELQIESLHTTLAREQAAGTLSPNGQVASERIELLRAALGWDAIERRLQAAEAIQATLRVLPWSKKSRAERQADLERLRNPG